MTQPNIHIHINILRLLIQTDKCAVWLPRNWVAAMQGTHHVLLLILPMPLGKWRLGQPLGG